MSIMIVLLFFPPASCEESNSPFRDVINLLYNINFAPCEKIFYDPYSGPPVCKDLSGPVPGWITTGRADFEIDRKIYFVPPGSLAIKKIHSDAAYESLPILVNEAEFAMARCKVYVSGDPSGAHLALKWYLNDGSIIFSSSQPPARMDDFVELSLITKKPANSKAVSLVMEANPKAVSCRFDYPFLGFAEIGFRIFTFPEGYSKSGVREAIIRSRLPLSKPWGRVEFGGKSKSIRVYPLQVHKSGFYYYAADLSLFKKKGDYTITILDGILKERTAKSSFSIRTAPYKEISNQSFKYIETHFTKKKAGEIPFEDLSKDLTIFGMTVGIKTSLNKRAYNLGKVLKERLELKEKNLPAECGAFNAWAFATLGRSLSDKGFLSEAKKMLYKTWKENKWKGEPLAVCALCGAGSILADKIADPLSRDIADDMVREILRLKLESTGSVLNNGHFTVSWPIIAISEYILSVPTSNMIPMVKEALSRFYSLEDRLLTDTPFGQAKVLLKENKDIEIPTWTEGNTLYLLSTACALSYALKASRNDRFWYHIERQIQFVFGYNPLGKNLIKEKIFSIRSATGKYYRPGTRLICECPDPLKVHLYLAWSSGELRGRAP